MYESMRPAIKYCRLGSLNSKFIFSQFWKPEFKIKVLGQGGWAEEVPSFLLRFLCLACGWPSSPCVFHTLLLHWSVPRVPLRICGHQSYGISSHPNDLTLPSSPL